ncbi:MAG TPA: hypothetical protein VFQ39_09110 [Longimicrobium sp.]|nr:hypothetical protein [Longimicrobium sp.]
MKTWITLSDELRAAADEFARSRGWSRSRVFAAALAEYVAKHEKREDRRVDGADGDGSALGPST